MGMDAIGEAFVRINYDGKAAEEGLARLKESFAEMGKGMEKISSIARGVFYALAGLGSLLTGAAVEAEDAQLNLQAALRQSAEMANANAQAMGGVGKSAKQIASETTNATKELTEFAESIERITAYSKEQIQAGMEVAANYGVQADQMKLVTEVGMGLAVKFFKGDMQAGMEAAARAANGNMRSLTQLVPGLKQAGSAAEQLAIVQKEGLSGFDEAKERSNTLGGSLKQLYNQMTELAESLGQFLLPALKEEVTWLKGIVDALNRLTPAQKETIVKWGEIAAAIAAVIGFGPMIVTFCASVGGALIALVSSPMVLFVAGVAAMMTAIAYFIGSGDTMTARLTSGFAEIGDFLNHLLGSWQGFAAGASVAMDGLQGVWIRVWYGLKSAVVGIWDYMETRFPNIIYGWGGAIAEFALKAFSVMKSICNAIVNMWQTAVDAVANLIEKHEIGSQADADIHKQFGGRVLNDEDAKQLAAPALAANRHKYEQEARDKGITDNSGITDYVQSHIQPENDSILADYKAKYSGKTLSSEDMGQLVQATVDSRMAIKATQDAGEKKANAAMAAAQAKSQADVDKAISDVHNWQAKGANPKQSDNDIAAINSERDKALAENKAKQDADYSRLMNAPKLSDDLSALKKKYDIGGMLDDLLSGNFGKVFDNLKKKLGLDKIEDVFNGLKKKADDAKNAADDATKPDGNLSLTQAAYGGSTTKQNISDVFKNMVGNAMLSNTMRQHMHQADPKLKAAQDGNKILDAIQKAIKEDVAKALASLPGAIGAFLGYK